jgi:hypothetical protein
MAILLALQFGLWLHAAQVAEAAAQEGLEAARAEQGSAAAGETRALAFVGSVGGLQAPAAAAARSADGAQVTVSGTAPEVVPGFPAISARASGPLERFVPEPERGP